MQRTSEFVMSSSKTGAAWAFYVFDKWDEPGDYYARANAASAAVTDAGAIGSRLRTVRGECARNAADATAFEADLVASGYEGAILRDPRAPYKHGRSGSKGPLLEGQALR